MSKAVYWQRGESLDYPNTTTSKIEAGTVVTLTERIGVIGGDILPGETGAVHVMGVYDIPKTGTVEIKLGAKVYFDGNGITNVATGNVLAGYAAEDSPAGAAAIKIKIG